MVGLVLRSSGDLGDDAETLNPVCGARVGLIVRYPGSGQGGDKHAISGNRAICTCRNISWPLIKSYSSPRVCVRDYACVGVADRVASELCLLSDVQIILKANM